MTAKLSPTQMAWRAAQDIPDGAYVNLGIGFPEMVAKFQPPGREAIFHTENGILGFGAAPVAGQEDWDLINAGKKAEFGQGLFRIAACDQWVGIKPTYTAAIYPGGTSRVNGMHIMGLDAANCKGVNFKIQFYQTGVATALDIFVDKNGANSNRVMLSVCKVCTISTNQQRLDAVSLINSSGQNIGYGDGIEYIDFEVTTGDYIWLLENGATPLATNSAINRTTVESASY